MADIPPSVSPYTTARRDPAAASTDKMSCMLSSSGNHAVSPGTGSETPEPRMSYWMTRPSRASRSKKRTAEGSSHSASMFDTPPVTNMMSRSPCPKTW